MLCIVFCWINSINLTVRKISLSWFHLSLLDEQVSGDFNQLSLLLSVCLGLDFIQDQEPVKKGPLGAQSIDSDCQSDC